MRKSEIEGGVKSAIVGEAPAIDANGQGRQQVSLKGPGASHTVWGGGAISWPTGSGYNASKSLVSNSIPRGRRTAGFQVETSEFIDIVGRWIGDDTR